MRKLIKVTGVTNGAGSTGSGVVSVNVPTGYDITGIFSVLTAGTAAVGTYSNIKLTGDGDILWDLSGTEFDELNKAQGLTAFDGTTFYFPACYPKQRDMVPAIGTAIRTRTGGGPDAYANLVFEMTMASATTPAFDIYLEVSNEANVSSGMVRRLRTYQDQTVVGAMSTTKLNYGPGGSQYWAGSYMVHSGNISRIRIKRGDTLVYDTVKAVNDYALVVGGGVVGSYFAWSLAFLGYQFPEPMNTGDLRNGDKNLDFEVTSDSAATIKFVQDTYGPK